MILTVQRHYKTRTRFLRAFHVHRARFVACISDATGVDADSEKGVTSMAAFLDPPLSNILDTFSGADGGVRFVRFRDMYSVLVAQADMGDKKARELVTLVYRFSKLIDIAQTDIPRKA